MNNILKVCAVTVLVFSFSIMHTVSLCADDFHSDTYGYAVNIPTHWTKWPDRTLQSFLIEIMGDDTEAVWEVAFQPSNNMTGLYPYLIIQVITYDSLGIDQQLNNSESKELIELMTDMKLSELQGRSGRDKYGAKITTRMLRKPRYESINNRLFIPGSYVLDGIDARYISAVFFGKEAVVKLNFYGRADDWNTQTPTFVDIMNSFTFDRDTEFDLAEAVRTNLGSKDRSWSDSLAKIVAYIIVGVGITLISVVVSFFKRKTGADKEDCDAPPLKCPSCGLINSATSEHCDCGHQFTYH